MTYMSDRFAVEADRRVVGVAVRAKDGFRFFSSDPNFTPLEGKKFARLRSMNHRIAQLARRRRTAAARPESGRLN